MMKQYYSIYFLFILTSLQASDRPANNAWDNEKYQEDPTVQYYFGQYLLSQIPFDQTDIVLDLGCGNGKITRAIAQEIPAGCVIGIDNNPTMLQQAQQNYRHITNARFELIDATKFESNTLFTKIVAICSLSWMPKQQAVYEKVSAALAPGGQFFALVSDAQDPLCVSYHKTMKKPQWKTYFKNYHLKFYPSTIEEIQKYLTLTQLKATTLKKVKFLPMQLDKRSFIEKLNANPGVKDTIPQEHYETFLNDVAAEYIAHTKPDDENNMEIGCGLILVIAKKNNPDIA